MTGCLEKGADATMFRLTNVEGTGPKTVELHADASKKLALMWVTRSLSLDRTSTRRR